MDWDRITTEMVRQMIRQFLSNPAEFLSFNQLARRIAGGDADLLHALAEAKPELFVLTRRGDAIKLHSEAVPQILQGDADLTILHPIVTPEEEPIGRYWSCQHLSEDEVFSDLLHGTISANALTRSCCWSRICQVRGRNLGIIDAESWRELCRVRGYLLATGNPGSF